jgi:hypothetical protein
MHKLTIAAMTIAFGAMLVSAPAVADNLQGGPAKNGSQCFKLSPGNDREQRFGSWGACPQTASTAASAAQRQNARRPASR